MTFPNAFNVCWGALCLKIPFDRHNVVSLLSSSSTIHTAFLQYRLCCFATNGLFSEEKRWRKVVWKRERLNTQMHTAIFFSFVNRLMFIRTIYEKKTERREDNDLVLICWSCSCKFVFYSSFWFCNSPFHSILFLLASVSHMYVYLHIKSIFRTSTTLHSGFTLCVRFFFHLVCVCVCVLCVFSSVFLFPFHTHWMF